MAHFADVDENNVVTRVVVVDNVNAPDPAPQHAEPIGAAFLDSLGLQSSTRWVQTSYHGSFRKQFAGIGFRYDADADVFVAPQPFPSWALDADHDWQPPTPMPTEGGPWVWDEDTLSWIEVTA